MIDAVSRLSGLVLLTVLSGCVSAQRDLPPKPLVAPVACVSAPALAELAATAAEPQSDQGGIRVLDTGREGFLARAALIEAAACSIDAQYYIWNSDASGRYLASRLLAAAGRGVHVRLLLDDINVGDREDVLAALALHPNVEVQIFNPFAERRGLRKGFNFLGEFTRLNRRMHNKSLTVDRAVTILGGRNIGDEYFDASEELNFSDRDVMATGPVVTQTAAMFDAFWNWTLSRPVSEVAGSLVAPDGDQVKARVTAATERMISLHGPLPETQEAGLESTSGYFLEMLSVPARLVYDPPPDPDAMGDTAEPQPGSVALRAVAGGTRSELLVESAYLVLDDTSLANVRELRGRGVRIRALTNSLASNDVTANHAAYARRRVKMLEGGIDLYELRPDAASCVKIVQKEAACAKPHGFGLHAKTFVVDRRIVYVGSLNMNLRSRYLNSESGLIIDSPVLAGRIAADIEENMRPGNSWRPLLNRHGRVRWYETDDASKTYDREPQVGWSRRTRSGFIALLPLEKYL